MLCFVVRFESNILPSWTYSGDTQRILHGCATIQFYLQVSAVTCEKIKFVSKWTWNKLFKSSHIFVTLLIAMATSISPHVEDKLCAMKIYHILELGKILVSLLMDIQSCNNAQWIACHNTFSIQAVSRVVLWSLEALSITVLKLFASNGFVR